MKKFTRISVACAALVHVAVLAFPASAYATQPLKADTVIIDVPLSEQRFVSNSLLLLAARYNVDIARSQVTQARAWYNPNIVYSQTLYDPASGAWLDNSKESGQVDVQISELFSLAGRHINAVRLAEIDAQRTQLSFDALALSLKFGMYDDLASLYEAQQTNRLLSRELASLDNLILAAQKELGLGAAAGNDVIRLKAERQTTLIDKLANLNQIDELEGRLRVLLGFTAGTYLRVGALPAPSAQPPSVDSLLVLSGKRPDVLLAAKDVEWNSRNLKLQHSAAAPDLALGTEYDRRSSYTNNLWMISAGIDIPLFNRNQGNIRAAKYSLLQSQYMDTLAGNNAQSEVIAAYSQYARIKAVRDSIQAQPGVISHSGNVRGSYSQDLDLMFNNAIANYSARRIGLIEFLDQLRTYDDAQRDLITLDADYFVAAQQLNYSTGSMVIR